jgi:hypothetical protein
MNKRAATRRGYAIAKEVLEEHLSNDRQYPDMSSADVVRLEESMRELIAELDRRARGRTRAPRPPKPQRTAREISVTLSASASLLLRRMGHHGGNLAGAHAPSAPGRSLAAQGLVWREKTGAVRFTPLGREVHGIIVRGDLVG